MPFATVAKKSAFDWADMILTNVLPTVEVIAAGRSDRKRAKDEQANEDTGFKTVVEDKKEDTPDEDPNKKYLLYGGIGLGVVIVLVIVFSLMKPKA